MDIDQKFEFIIKNISKIPDRLFVISENDRRVFWFFKGDDGTAGSYESSEEAFGITKEGEIVWGFSSGCSCWDGWGAGDIESTPTYKEFIIRDISFVGHNLEDSINEILHLIESYNHL